MMYLPLSSLGSMLGLRISAEVMLGRSHLRPALGYPCRHEN